MITQREDRSTQLVERPSMYTANYTMTMTMTIFYSTKGIHIEIIMYNSLENQIINWSGDYY